MLGYPCENIQLIPGMFVQQLEGKGRAFIGFIPKTIKSVALLYLIYIVLGVGFLPLRWLAYNVDMRHIQYQGETLPVPTSPLPPGISVSPGIR